MSSPPPQSEGAQGNTYIDFARERDGDAMATPMKSPRGGLKSPRGSAEAKGKKSWQVRLNDRCAAHRCSMCRAGGVVLPGRGRCRVARATDALL